MLGLYLLDDVVPHSIPPSKYWMSNRCGMRAIFCTSDFVLGKRNACLSVRLQLSVAILQTILLFRLHKSRGQASYDIKSRKQ
eukprot:6376898-Amphidinium_carterae.1